MSVAGLVMKKAACSGCAKTYTLLCDVANVLVRHFNQSSWTHQWNKVKIYTELVVPGAEKILDFSIDIIILISK
jgi:hypothetical protein